VQPSTLMDMTTGDSSQNITTFDPLIRITDGDRHVHVMVDLPGVTEEQILIDHRQKTLMIAVREKETLFQKEVSIPQTERISKKKFSDGVLEISLEKSRSGSDTMRR